MQECESQICIVGGGPAGLVAALALAQSSTHRGVRSSSPVVTLVAERASGPDGRTAALFSGSIRLLERLGAWEHVRMASEPLRGIRLADTSGHLLRPPEVSFLASEIGLEVLGYNVPNEALTNALWALAEADPSISVVPGAAVAVTPSEGAACIDLVGGARLSARLVIGADGRSSVCRIGAGIRARRWTYPQSAIVARLQHSRSHHGISTEVQDTHGPCTTVPLAGNASSLVWVVSPGEAQRLCVLPPPAFARNLEARLGGLLGTVLSVSDIGVFPLMGLAAERLANRRVVLVGEAGHVVVPIGAQGLNMGLADAAVIAELAGSALADGNDPGCNATLAAYEARRQGDVWRRSLAVGFLNQTYVSAILPGHVLRGIGLHAIAAIGPLKRAVMRRGLEPDPLPALMRCA